MSAFLGGHDLSGSSQALKSLWKIQWQMSQEPVAQRKWITGQSCRNGDLPATTSHLPPRKPHEDRALNLQFE